MPIIVTVIAIDLINYVPTVSCGARQVIKKLNFFAVPFYVSLGCNESNTQGDAFTIKPYLVDLPLKKSKCTTFSFSNRSPNITGLVV